MRLVWDWPHILRRAWSIRLIVLAGILSGLEVALPFIDAFVFIPTGLLAFLSFLVTCAAFVARIIAQKGLYG